MTTKPRAEALAGAEGFPTTTTAVIAAEVSRGEQAASRHAPRAV